MAVREEGISAVVPTLGMSPLLVPCLEALRREGGGVGEAGESLEIVLVDQGPTATELPPGLIDHRLRLPENLGFAAGTNAGIAASSGTWVAVVNDDLVVEPGWLPALLAALRGDEKAAGAQGWNLREQDPSRIDGGGLAWNRAWQAVQIGCGYPVPAPRAESGGGVEIFGVSATAALYRRGALEEVSLGAGAVFDPALVSYYEDVDLACRLRAAGWRSWRVPAARARHAGSLTGRRLGWRRLAYLYGNRYLVLARFLGAAFRDCLGAALIRDAKDLARALIRGDGRTLVGIAAGWLRALRRLPHFTHGGRPALPPDELRHFLVGAPGEGFE